MTRLRMSKILSCASCLVSYSRYLSQKGCDKKSKPMWVAALSKSLAYQLEQCKQNREGMDRLGRMGKYRRGSEV